MNKKLAELLDYNCVSCTHSYTEDYAFVCNKKDKCLSYHDPCGLYNSYHHINFNELVKVLKELKVLTEKVENE